MSNKLKNSLKALQNHLSNLSEEEKEELEEHFKDDTPKGWLSIEDHLPMMMAMDIMKGATEYKIRFKNGEEGTTLVSDHNTWYYYAKENKITHWLNE